MSNFIPVNEPLLNGNEKKYLADCIDTSYVSTAAVVQCIQHCLLDFLMDLNF